MNQRERKNESGKMTGEEEKKSTVESISRAAAQSNNQTFPTQQQ